MVATRIEYVELYATDRDAAADYLVSGLGFTAAGESVSTDYASLLLQQGDIELILTTGDIAASFLDAHGDGVVDVALGCDDVAATAAAARAAGAQVTESGHDSPLVAGFGGVRHSLLPSYEGTTRRLWRPTPPSMRPAPTEPARLSLLDHIALCVPAGTLGDHVEFYETALGLPHYSAEYIAVGDQAMESVVVRSDTGGVTFTLLAPDAARSPGQIDAFLEHNGGAGVQHLAFLVDDIVMAVAGCARRGVEFLTTPEAYYERLQQRLPELTAEIGDLRGANVLADRDEWGYLLQLFTRSPYPANTLFYELIQRRGSRGFGTGNIRALYEAIDRDMFSAA